MSRAQERGLIEALGEAEGLANVLRAMSGGKLDLQPVAVGKTKHFPALPMTWMAAQAEAWQIAARHQDPRLPVAVQREINHETFCSVCGPLDEPGVHTQRDCPRWQEVQDHGGVTMVARYEPGIHTRADCHPVGSTEDRLEAIEVALATQREMLRQVLVKLQPLHQPIGPADSHTADGPCRRCGDRHTTGEAQQLNALLARDRAPGPYVPENDPGNFHYDDRAPTGRPSPQEA